MLEEIKKEIENYTLHLVEPIAISTVREQIFEILDKYQDKEIDKTKFINEFLEANPWKKMWEELKDKNLLLATPNMKLLRISMQELEQKYNIGSEDR